MYIQASGWPAWVKTDADRRRYVREYGEREGIMLDPNKIAKNPGLRALSKLGLNSFVSYFCYVYSLFQCVCFSGASSVNERRWCAHSTSAIRQSTWRLSQMTRWRCTTVFFWVFIKINQNLYVLFLCVEIRHFDDACIFFFLCKIGPCRLFHKNYNNGLYAMCVNGLFRESLLWCATVDTASDNAKEERVFGEWFACFGERFS